MNTYSHTRKFTLSGVIAALLGAPVTAAYAADFGNGDLITSTIAGAVPRGGKMEGIRAGNYYIQPSVAAFTAFDDNIFSSSSDRISDIRTELTPMLKFQSDFPRHVLDLSLAGKIVDYADHSEQNYANVSADLKGALHFDHAHTLSLSVLSRLEHTELGAITTPTAAAEPIPVFHNRASIGVTRDAGRLYGTVSATAERFDYSDVKATDGSIVDQDARDLDKYSAQLRTGYRFSPGYEIVGKITGLRQLNRGDTLGGQDATGYEALAGLAFDTDPILHWHLMAGYGIRDFDDPSLDRIATSLLEADVVWEPTARMTITGSAARMIVAALDQDGDARVESSLVGAVTYEIWHNLTARAELALIGADYTGNDRRDLSKRARVGLEYNFIENWSFTAGFEHQERDSNDDALDMTRNRVTIGAKLKF